MLYKKGKYDTLSKLNTFTFKNYELLLENIFINYYFQYVKRNSIYVACFSNNLE